MKWGDPNIGHSMIAYLLFLLFNDKTQRVTYAIAIREQEVWAELNQ